MIVDVDDLYEGHDRLDLLLKLKEANPLFRCTAFAIPARCSDSYLRSLPDWIEVAVHGFEHGDPPTDGGECRDWPAERMEALMASIAHRNAYTGRWVFGFKAPGWQISDGCYEALLAYGWWVADHYENDARRPAGIRLHRLSEGASSGADPIHTHHHVQDVCGNGLAETFPALLERVRAAESFELVSEAVQPWA